MEEAYRRVVVERDEAEGDRKRTVEALVEVEAAVGERERDLQLKEAKIESLKSILKRREDITEQVGRMEESKVASLEQDRQKLIRDNLVLIKEVQALKEQIKNLQEDGSAFMY